MNTVMIAGRIGKMEKPKQDILNLSVATNEVYKDKQGEKVEKTLWHKCVAFGKNAELIERFFEKGQVIIIEGRLNYGSYEKDGVKHYTTDIIINRWHFGGSPKPEGNKSEPEF